MCVAIVSGVTGLVGHKLLLQLIEDDAISNIICLSRKQLDFNCSKLDQKVDNFENLIEKLKCIKADIAFCCLGTTIKKAGSKNQQYIIDHDYVIEFAKACHASGVKKFAVVSSIGAHSQSSNFYLRTKGQMENDLKKIPFESLFILRPSILLGQRNEYRFGEEIGKVILQWASPLLFGSAKKYRGIHASAVASKMINLCKSDLQGIHIIESDHIKN